MIIKYWLHRIVFLVRNKLFFSTLLSHVQSKDDVSQEKILPVVSIEAITDGSEAQLVERDYAEGNVSIEELQCIAKLVRFHQPARIFEIGTFDGRTTINMAHNAERSEIFTLDLPKKDVSNTKLRIKKGDVHFINKEVSGSRFIGTKYEKQITQIYADSAAFDYVPYYGSIDLVFIDGSHTYDYVISDTRNALKLLRPEGGIILWHDYGWKEVIKALNEFYRNDPVFSKLQNIENTSLAILKIDSFIH
jgi:predicted O-methyltransferase YrrM